MEMLLNLLYLYFQILANNNQMRNMVKNGENGEKW